MQDYAAYISQDVLMVDMLENRQLAQALIH